MMWMMGTRLVLEPLVSEHDEPVVILEGQRTMELSPVRSRLGSSSITDVLLSPAAGLGLKIVDSLKDPAPWKPSVTDDKSAIREDRKMEEAIAASESQRDPWKQEQRDMEAPLATSRIQQLRDAGMYEDIEDPGPGIGPTAGGSNVAAGSSKFVGSYPHPVVTWPAVGVTFTAPGVAEVGEARARAFPTLI